MMKLRNVLQDTKGATAIEYALIASMISIAAIAAMQGLGGTLNKTLTSVGSSMKK